MGTKEVDYGTKKFKEAVKKHGLAAAKLMHPAWQPGSWTPVRRGLIYCSPACGAKCTWSAYHEATRKADELCKQLGQGWRPRVWENMGWFWECVYDKITISNRSDSRTFEATLGNKLWVEARTPERALQKLLAEFVKIADEAHRDVEQIQNSMSKL